MYAVVGCSECSALGDGEGSPETTQCPRCGQRRPHAKRRTFVETDDEAHAREVRSSMLATRQGEGEAFAELDSFAEMDRELDERGIDDETYLTGSGLDSEAVAAAGDRASQGAAGSQSRRDTVLAALDELDRPSESDVVAFCTERGVPADYVRTALRKLARAGEVSESGGTYRRL